MNKRVYDLSEPKLLDFNYELVDKGTISNEEDSW